MYSVDFSDLAKKQLFKLPVEIQKRIINALQRIRIRPQAYVTKLVGDESYRLRVGDYRIIMDIHQDTLLVLVLEVGHRMSEFSTSL